MRVSMTILRFAPRPPRTEMSLPIRKRTRVSGTRWQAVYQQRNCSGIYLTPKSEEGGRSDFLKELALKVCRQFPFGHRRDARDRIPSVRRRKGVYGASYSGLIFTLYHLTTLMWIRVRVACSCSSHLSITIHDHGSRTTGVIAPTAAPRDLRHGSACRRRKRRSDRKYLKTGFRTRLA